MHHWYWKRKSTDNGECNSFIESDQWTWLVRFYLVCLYSFGLPTGDLKVNCACVRDVRGLLLQLCMRHATIGHDITLCFVLTRAGQQGLCLLPPSVWVHFKYTVIIQKKKHTDLLIYLYWGRLLLWNIHVFLKNLFFQERPKSQIVKIGI